MIPDPTMLWVAGGAAGLLAAFTLAGLALDLAVTGEAARQVVANLNARVRSWWVMVAVFGAALLLGQGAIIGLFAMLSFLALREFVSLTPTRAGDRVPLFLAFFVVVPLQYGLVGTGWYGLFAILIPVYVFLTLPALSALGADTTDYLARNAKLQWGLLLTVYCLSHAPALLLLGQPGGPPGAALLLYLVVVAQISDVFQYVFGKLLGRRRLAPAVSPSKTVEGLLGGGAVAVAVGAALHGLTPFSPLQSAGMAAAVVAAGFFGGFVLSAIKRDLGVKDWGRLIEGHGGILDRLDSVAFAAPLFFHLTRYGFA